MNEGSKWILVLNGWKWRHFGSGWVMMIGSQIARQQGFNPRHSESCSFFNVQDALLFSVLRCPQMFLEDSNWIDLIIFDWFLGRFLNWKSLQTLKGQRRGPQPTLKLVMVALKKWLLGSQKRSRISLFWGNQTCRISAYRRRVRKHTEGAVRCCLQVYPFVSASSISRGCVVAPNMEHLCGTCWRHRQNCCCGQSQKRHPTTLRRSSAAVESAESLVESRIHKDWLCKSWMPIAQTGWEACAKDVKTEGGTQLKRCLVSLCFAQWDCCACVLDSYCRQSGYSRYRGTSSYILLSSNAHFVNSLEGSRVCCCQSSYLRLFRQWWHLGALSTIRAVQAWDKVDWMKVRWILTLKCT